MRKVPLFVGMVSILASTASLVAHTAGPECYKNPEERLQPFLDEFGFEELPPPLLPPDITFVSAVRSGNLLYLSGNGPFHPETGFITGRVPSTISEEDAKRAALLTGINQLGVIKQELGSLKRVKRFVKVFGMVNADVGFTDQPDIINGASDLFVEVFGPCGYSARSAVGVQSLPFGIPVEIDMIIEVKGRKSHDHHEEHDD